MTTAPNRLENLNQRLSAWMRWYRLRRAADWGGYGLVFGMAAGLGFSLAAVFAARLLLPEFILFTLLSGLLGLAFAAAAGYLWRLSPQQAAVYFDHALGLKERLSTALELAQPGRAEGIPAELVQRQREDALAASQAVNPRLRLPLRFNRIQAIVSVLILAIVTLVALRGETLFQAALQRRAVQQAISQQIERIEAIQSTIENDPSLTPEQKEALLQPLDDALQGLQEAETVEEAVSVLTAAEQELEALQDPAASQQSQALQEMGDSLSQQQGSPLQEFGQELASGDVAGAAQELSQIDPASLSAEEAAALAEQLQEAAEALQSTDPALAEQLSQAAEALQNGDTEAAQQALQQASQSLAQTGQQIAGSQAAGEAASQVGQGQQQMLQSGLGQQAQSGQGQGEGQGEGQGDGSSTQAGDAGAGGGSGEGSGDAGDAQGSEAGEDPISQGNGPGDGGESAYEPIYAPEHLGGEGGADVTLPTSDDPNGEVVGQGNATPGDPNQSSVPYVEAYPYYEQFYRQALENGRVPMSMREYVRRYFSSLEP